MALCLESSCAGVMAENEVVEHESLSGAWQIISDSSESVEDLILTCLLLQTEVRCQRQLFSDFLDPLPLDPFCLVLSIHRKAAHAFSESQLFRAFPGLSGNPMVEGD